MANSAEELSYMRTKNYLGILNEFDESYFSWNGGDKRLTDKGWTKTDDIVILILRIYPDMFVIRKNNICLQLLPAILYINDWKQ